MLDIAFINARIVDGTGTPWQRGCVGVHDGRIVQVGSNGDLPEAANVIDVDDHVLCPGFIDSHSHSDLSVLENPESSAKIMQGVTTENVGLDSLSVAPISDRNKEQWQISLSGLDGILNRAWDWNSFSSYLDRVDAAMPSVNISSYVGLGTVRLDVMGMENRPPTAAELRRMKESIAECMQQGARGISAGLIYTPNKYQSTEELIALAKTAASYDGLFDVHMRNEADHMTEALDEIIHIARESGIRVMITHFKARGRRNWGTGRKHLDTIDRARQEGVDISIAQYPYTANSTLMHVVVPPWYHSRGMDGMLKALVEEREQVKKDMLTTDGWENFSEVMGWENIYVSSVNKPQNSWCEGLSAVQIGERLHCSPEDAILDLLIDERLAVGLLGFGMSEEDVIEGIKHPSMCVITDGLLSGKKPHPRTYAAFPRFLARYVREKHILSLEEAVRKMTFNTARRLRMKHKGLILQGMDADIVVFDEQRILDVNSFEEPRIHPQGIDLVCVNGEIVVRDGVHTGARPGRTIRDH
ncbi:N-acyl-D-amino-acid deacylase family protein [Bilophila wadsworthia]|uniref:N-acyl-D-amino-acid deacylase family protein n=1 Tax=Bilophila wadsworthia TaxID=35833 RepID=UPI00242F2257|nr:D-aminoacylase [Bilophila wadsworthia]